MTLAIDIDATWTADPWLFLTFAEMAISRGHTVIIVTGMPQPQDKLDRLGIPRSIPIIVSHGELKEHAARKAGYEVSIWIEDMPGMVQDCRILKDDLV